MHRVEGKENLYKDPDSGAIINNDKNSYELAKANKRRILKERQKQQSLEERIEYLESIIKRMAEKDGI
jgi:folate-dependent phosphoribosylglycinamide formyltransferase PurN